MNRARALVEYVPVRLLSAGLHLMPRRAALSLGRLAGLAFWSVDATHRRVARGNLRAAFGEGDHERLIRRVFSHFGSMAVECLLMRHRRPSDVETLIDYEGVEHLRGAFMKGKGVFVFSAHFGNWEMVALMQGFLGYPMAMVTRPLDNPWLERLLAEGRRRSGNEIIHKSSAARGIIRALKHGWCVAIVIDQDTRGAEHVFVDFFGRPAATTPALARLALRTGAPIVPVFGIPMPDGRYRITYLPEVPVQRTDNHDADVVSLTQECTRIIEDQIRNHPELWLWIHRRWKRRPGPAARAETGSAQTC